MKKTYLQLTPTLEQVTVENANGEKLTFLNGVIQLPTGGKFLAAQSPLDRDLMLIIEDYVYWVQNQKAIEAWIEDHGTRIKQQGMVIHFDNDADRTMFLLRWG